MFDLMQEFEVTSGAREKNSNAPTLARKKLKLVDHVREQMKLFRGEPTKAVKAWFYPTPKGSYDCSLKFGTRFVDITGNGENYLKGFPKDQVEPFYKRIIQLIEAGDLDSQIQEAWDASITLKQAA